MNNVYDELIQLTGTKQASTDDLKAVAQSGKKQNPFMSLIKVLSDIFVPIVPRLVAVELLMAINNVLTAQDLFGPQSVIEMYPNLKDVTSIINLLASAPFAFLPILVGFSATRRFGGNPYLGAKNGNGDGDAGAGQWVQRSKCCVRRNNALLEYFWVKHCSKQVTKDRSYQF